MPVTWHKYKVQILICTPNFSGPSRPLARQSHTACDYWLIMLKTGCCWGTRTTGLLVRPSQAEDGGGCCGYLAASPQVGGCVDVDYGYDAEVYLQIHLGEFGGQKQWFPAYTFFVPICKPGVWKSTKLCPCVLWQQSSCADRGILKSFMWKAWSAYLFRFHSLRRCQTRHRSVWCRCLSGVVAISCGGSPTGWSHWRQCPRSGPSPCWFPRMRKHGFPQYSEVLLQSCTCRFKLICHSLWVRWLFSTKAVEVSSSSSASSSAAPSCPSAPAGSRPPATVSLWSTVSLPVPGDKQ